jgi:hypothetical protein
VIRIRIRYADTNSSPIPILYERALLGGPISPDNKPQAYLLHQYEATSYGTRMRSTLRSLEPRPPEAGDAWARHNKSEIGRFPDFLPQLYRLWQAVKDPAINRQCSFKLVETVTKKTGK